MGTVDTTIENWALAAVKVLSCLGVVRAAYLFGSHVEGTPDQWSDIDVAVFMEGVERWNIDQRAEVMAGIISETIYWPVSALVTSWMTGAQRMPSGRAGASQAVR